MDTLKTTTLRVMQTYTGKGLNGEAYLTHTADELLYTVIAIGRFRNKLIVNTSLVVRFEANIIKVEQDLNDKPLVDALMQAGIPRDNIILAYAGEKVPETA